MADTDTPRLSSHRVLSRSTIDLLWSIAAGLLLLAKGLWDNRALFGHDLAPLDDAAADMLLSERMHHGLLLTGQYNFIGVYHPGPFLFYVRWLFEPLAPLVGSLHLAHLIAMMALGSVFLAMVAVLALRLTRDMTVGRGAVMAGLCAFPLQLTGGDWYATLFVPHYLPLPTAAFILATILLARGSTLGLLAATLLTGILAHAYIPLAPAVVLIWGLAVARGHLERHRALGRGYTAATWGACATIIGLFVLPIALDTLLNPPGNIVAILHTAQEPAPHPGKHLLINAAAWALGKCLLPRDFLVPVMLLGIGLAIRRRRFRRLWREIIVVSALLLALEVAIISHSGVGIFPYMLDFGTAPLALALLLSIMEIMVAARELLQPPAAQALPAALMTGTTAVTLVMTSTLHSSELFSTNVAPLVTAITERSKPGELVSITSERLYAWYMPLTLMVQLDRTDIQSCFEHRELNRKQEALMTAAATWERLCAHAGRPPDHAFRIKVVAPCPWTSHPSYREEELGYRAATAIGHWLGVPRQSFDTLRRCDEEPSPAAIVRQCLTDHLCYTLEQVE